MEATPGEEHQDESESVRMDLMLLCVGKKAGLSFDEINLMRVQDLLDYTNIYSEQDKDKPRKATQTDIDKFYAS